MRKGTGLLLGGAMLIAGGLLALLLAGHSASACGSTLGQFAQTVTSHLASQCATVHLFDFAAWAALGIGALLVIVGAIRTNGEGAAPELAPGWYEVGPGVRRYWDGARWQGPPRTER